MKQEPDSIQKLVVLIKFVFSILTCRSKIERIGAWMGFISTSFSRSAQRTNISIVETSWKTDICIVEKDCPWPNWEFVLACLLVCIWIFVLIRVYLLRFIAVDWVLKQVMMEWTWPMFGGFVFVTFCAFGLVWAHAHLYELRYAFNGLVNFISAFRTLGFNNSYLLEIKLSMPIQCLFMFLCHFQFNGILDVRLIRQVGRIAESLQDRREVRPLQ